MQIIASILILLSIAFVKVPHREPKKIAIITIPKSGTHMINKAVELITGITPQHTASKDFKDLEEMDHDYAISWHLFPKFDESKSNDKIIKIVGIRDLRDICISGVDWLSKERWWCSNCDHSEFFNLNAHDRLSYMIDFPEDYYFFSIESFAQRALEWMNQPNVLVCRFEDLVGPKGGGDRKLQEKAIADLARHLGYTLRYSKISEIADKLYGNTRTFRKGKQGNWKDEFAPDHKDLFKTVMGDKLIEMGYEEDFNW